MDIIFLPLEYDLCFCLLFLPLPLQPVYQDIPRSHFSFSNMLSNENTKTLQLPPASPGRRHRLSLRSDLPTFLGFLFIPPFLPSFLGEESRRDRFKNPPTPMLSSITSIRGGFSNLRIQKTQIRVITYFLHPQWPHHLDFQNGKALTVFCHTNIFLGYGH